MTEQELKDMRLHERRPIDANSDIIVMRVYNGWIYIFPFSTEMVYEITITQEHIEPRLK